MAPLRQTPTHTGGRLISSPTTHPPKWAGFQKGPVLLTCWLHIAWFGGLFAVTECPGGTSIDQNQSLLISVLVINKINNDRLHACLCSRWSRTCWKFSSFQILGSLWLYSFWKSLLFMMFSEVFWYITGFRWSSTKTTHVVYYYVLSMLCYFLDIVFHFSNSMNPLTSLARSG